MHCYHKLVSAAFREPVCFRDSDPERVCSGCGDYECWCSEDDECDVCGSVCLCPYMYGDDDEE